MANLIRILTGVVTCAAATAGLAAAPASSAASTTRLPRALDERTFAIDVKGVQTTTWTLNKPSTGPCDPPQTGHGSERVVFRTTRALRRDVRRYGTSYVLFGDPFKLGANDFVVRATVTRFGAIDSGTVAAGCGDNGGDGPVTPDCGAKHVTLDLQLGYLNEPRHGFTLIAGDIGLPVDPFHACPWTGGMTSFPHLLEKQRKRAILAALPVSDLFNRSLGQQIALARGAQRVHAGGLTAATSIRWDVRLTRVGR
jgi:hypothetical protein